MFTKGQSGELARVTSSNIPSPLKWFLGPFSDFASSLIYSMCFFCFFGGSFKGVFLMRQTKLQSINIEDKCFISKLQ